MRLRCLWVTLVLAVVIPDLGATVRLPATRASAAAGPPATAANRAGTSTHLVPLTDLDGGTYPGWTGGLYPNGGNEPPPDYLAAGVAQAQQVVPRSQDGSPDPEGKIGLLTIGMSNAAIESDAFLRALRADPSALNPAVVAVNGAQGGMAAAMITNPEDGSTGTRYWSVVDARLAQAGLGRDQVQAAWIKEADAAPRGSDIAYAWQLSAELQQIVGVLTSRFANLKFVYLSSRIYGGYASTTLNPEPYAYASGFAVKWTVQAFIDAAANGTPTGPWVGWGPYLWADGVVPRGDGLTWSCADLSPADGTHPSPPGAAKVAGLLLSFFSANPTTQPWFLANGAGRDN